MKKEKAAEHDFLAPTVLGRTVSPAKRTLIFLMKNLSPEAVE
jgi:hypothetical protein